MKNAISKIENKEDFIKCLEIGLFIGGCLSI